VSDDTIYIYKYGYHRVDGAWKRFDFEGEHSVGQWFTGSATAYIERMDDTEGTIVAYICQKVGGRWKCGCRDKVCATPYWQKQGYATEGEQEVVFGKVPSITNVSPDVVQEGEYMTLHGENFDIHNNTVETPFLVIDNVPSSDGKTIKVLFESVFMSDEYDDIRADIENNVFDDAYYDAIPFESEADYEIVRTIPMLIRVKNQYGYSDIFVSKFEPSLFIF